MITGNIQIKKDHLEASGMAPILSDIVLGSFRHYRRKRNYRPGSASRLSCGLQKGSKGCQITREPRSWAAESPRSTSFHHNTTIPGVTVGYRAPIYFRRVVRKANALNQGWDQGHYQAIRIRGFVLAESWV